MLISENGRALLTDFGLSFLTDSSFSLSAPQKVGGSLPWMAPEILDDYSTKPSATRDYYSAKPSAAGDVWSFAMTALVSFGHLYREIN